jgi:carboxylesterase
MSAVVDRGYRLEGGRVGYLLFHGLAGTPLELRFVARSLNGAGYTVHCPQMAGHCGTTADLKAVRWQDWVAGAEKALTELRKECDTVFVGGTSMGAIVALHLAARRPDDVQALTLFAPTLWLNGWAVPWYTDLFRLVQQDWCADLFEFTRPHPYGIKDDRIRAFLVGAMNTAASTGSSAEAGLMTSPGRAVLELKRLVTAAKKRLSSIKHPVLIVHPREDDLSSIKNALYLERHLGGLVQTCTLDDCYHMVTLDKQRDVLVERTKAFTAWTLRQLEKRDNVVGLPKVAAE